MDFVNCLVLKIDETSRFGDNIRPRPEVINKVKTCTVRSDRQRCSWTSGQL